MTGDGPVRARLPVERHVIRDSDCSDRGEFFIAEGRTSVPTFDRRT
jgi:hypothetical protein